MAGEAWRNVLACSWPEICSGPRRHRCAGMASGWTDLAARMQNLQFAKTSSEIAKQLYKFRGKVDEKGRPDLLGKHLNRIELAKQNAAAFQKHLKLDNARIDGALIFANTVPMSFAAERIGHAVTLLTYDQLELFVGRLSSSGMVSG